MLPFLREDVWENTWYLILNIFQVLQMPCSYKGAIKHVPCFELFFLLTPLFFSPFPSLPFCLFFSFFFLSLFILSSFLPLSSLFLSSFLPPLFFLSSLSARTINSTVGFSLISVVELLQLFQTWSVLIHIFLLVKTHLLFTHWCFMGCSWSGKKVPWEVCFNSSVWKWSTLQKR